MVDRTFSPEFVIVSAKDIAERAHELYVGRGYADGFDRGDWLRAEHELKNPVLAERVFPRDEKRRRRDKRVEQTGSTRFFVDGTR